LTVSVRLSAGAKPERDSHNYASRDKNITKAFFLTIHGFYDYILKISLLCQDLSLIGINHRSVLYISINSIEHTLRCVKYLRHSTSKRKKKKNDEKTTCLIFTEVKRLIYSTPNINHRHSSFSFGQRTSRSITDTW